MSWISNIVSKTSRSFLYALGVLLIFLIVFQLLELEPGIGFELLAPVLVISFIINHYLPLEYKPLMMLFHSLGVVYIAFGWLSGLLLFLGTVVVYFVLSSGIRYWVKIAFLLLFFISMLPWRLEIIYMPRIQIIVPFLAGFFMLRVWSFLSVNQLELEKKSVHAFNFFFLGPNLSFPLMPIIDYRDWKKAYNSSTETTYYTAIDRLAAGLFNLLLFRVIYHFLYIAPFAIHNGMDVIQFMLASYLMLLRLPGLFLLISGWLGLMGLNLPPVFGRFYFANTYSEVWRRINIYWKEFVVKQLYNPFFVLFGKFSFNMRMGMAIILAFALSSLLHTWQLLWIKGNFDFRITDLVYWTVLGCLVFVSGTIFPSKFIQRFNAQTKINFLDAMRNASAVLMVFISMSVLYSLWITGDIHYWVYILSLLQHFTYDDFYFLISTASLLLVGFAVLTMIFHRFRNHKEFFSVLPFSSGIFILMLFFLRFADPPQLKKLLHYVPNHEDVSRMEKDYYDAAVGSVNRRAYNWELILNRKRPEFFKRDDQLHRRRNDLLTRELRPSVSVDLNGSHYTTNSFGLRDKEYAEYPDSGCYRFAFLGASYTMGYGVNDRQSFEALLEDTLSRDYCVEFLNFGVGSYSLVQQVALLNEKVNHYHPGGVIYTAHSQEKFRVTRSFVSLVQNGIDLKYPALISIRDRAGLKQYMGFDELFSRTQPFSDELLDWGYKEIIYYCKTHSCVPIMVFAQATMDEENRLEWEALQQKAEGLGFVILDISNALVNYPVENIRVSELDHHPNAFGHQLLMRALYVQWKKNEEIIFNRYGK